MGDDVASRRQHVVRYSRVSIVVQQSSEKMVLRMQLICSVVKKLVGSLTTVIREHSWQHTQHKHQGYLTCTAMWVHLVSHSLIMEQKKWCVLTPVHEPLILVAVRQR